MKNWDLKPDTSGCTSDEDFISAGMVAEHLKIKLHQVNYVKEYWSEVFLTLLNKINNGLSPNIDVLCNNVIKFGKLYEWAISEMGFDFLATGHYAKVLKIADKKFGSGMKEMKTLGISDDPNKDQTFFLSRIPYATLEKIKFPLQNLTKPDVCKIAKNTGMKWLLSRKSTTGICFVGNQDKFGDFLTQNFMQKRPGKIFDIDSDDEQLSMHNGHFTYTIGQTLRNNLLKNENGQITTDRKFFVCKKDHLLNRLFATNSRNHPIFKSSVLKINNMHWLLPPGASLPPDFEIFFKHQAMHPASPARLDAAGEDLPTSCELNLYRADGPFVAGQSVSIYDYEHQNCIGCGDIV